MKTFKHKKTGWTAEDLEETLYSIYKPLKVDTLKTKVGSIPKDLVEDSSDWEEIIPKEWEILSFVNKGRILRVVNNVAFSGELLSKCLSNYPIHSVKRISDNVIFTLNDTLEYTTIKGIVIRADGKQCWLQSDLNNPDYGCCLSVAKKVEYLHTTKDGYKINSGDKYFIVDNFRIREVVGGTFTKSKWDDFRFKDKENAENWILYNKPCLCLIDVAKNVNAYGSDFEDLKKLIKTRL